MGLEYIVPIPVQVKSSILGIRPDFRIRIGDFRPLQIGSV